VSLTWSDLFVDDIIPGQFRAWSGVVGRIAPAFLNKFGWWLWFLRRPEGHVGRLERMANS
jgi:hypothetical protein